MPEPLIYTPSNELSEDDLNPRGSFHPYSATYRTKGGSPPADSSASALVRLPSDASSSYLPDPATFPLPSEYRFGGGSQLGSSVASISSAGGSGWRTRSSVRDSGASFGEFSTVDRRSAYEAPDVEDALREEKEEGLEDVLASPVESDGGQVFHRFSAQPAWSRQHRSRPSMAESILSSPGSSSQSHMQPQAVVGLGFSSTAALTSILHPTREPSTDGPFPSSAAGGGGSGAGSRWSRAYSSHSSAAYDRVAAYDSEDDKSDDGTSATSQYGWESEAAPDVPEGAAVVLVEDGRGKVVSGDAVDLTQMQRLAPSLIGTTHLLLSSTSTPELVPAFLAEVLPIIASTLVVLDVSSCHLSTFPPEILSLLNLEELDVSNNPLRTLPPALGDLPSLRVLAANTIGCTTLPSELGRLTCLHTLSIRNNRFYALPRWLCLLPDLQTLLVEGNPFQGFWKDFIEGRLLKWSPQRAEVSPEVETRDSFVSASSNLYARSQGSDVQPSSTATRSFSLPFKGEHHRSVSSASSHDRHSTLNAVRYGQRPSLPTSFDPPAAQSPGRARANTTFQADYNFSSQHQQQPQASDVPRSDTRPGVAPQAGPALPSTISRAPIRRLKSTGALAQAVKDAFLPASPSAAEIPLSPGLPPQFASGSTNRLVSIGKGKGRSTSNFLRKASDGVEMQPDESLPEDARRDGKRASANDKEKGKLKTMLKKMSMGRMRSGSGSGMGSALRPSPPVHSNTLPAVPSVRTFGRSSARRPSTSQGYASSQGLTTGGGSDYSTSRGPSPSGFQVISGAHLPPSPGMLAASGRTASKAKRRSFLNFDGSTPSLNSIAIPSTSPFMSTAFLSGDRPLFSVPDDKPIVEEDSVSILDSYHAPSPAASPVVPQEPAPMSNTEVLRRKMYADGLSQIMAYLQDLHDLSLSPIHPSVVPLPVDSTSDRSALSPSLASNPPTPADGLSSTPSLSTVSSGGRRDQRLGSDIFPQDPRAVSMVGSEVSSESAGVGERKYRPDTKQRAQVIMEIIQTEETYVNGLRELVQLYLRPAETLVPGTKDTIVPAAERKVVFNGLAALTQFHENTFLPALRKAAKPLVDDWGRGQGDDEQTLAAALRVADVFRLYNPFMRMYSTYINGFDNALLRLRSWTESSSSTPRSAYSSPSASSVHVATMGLARSALSPQPSSPDLAVAAPLSATQRKRIKHFLRDAQSHRRHSQINLEAYLLLPVQRIPRYKMLLDQLCTCTPPRVEEDNYILEDVAHDMASLAASMNEEKRESESRQRLVQWQSRINGRFPSPLVQPHRKLLLDGTLTLQKYIKRQLTYVEVVESVIDDGDNTITPVKTVVALDALESSDPQQQEVVVVLTSDLMILCQMGPSQDPEGPVDLYCVLRLQTKAQPASILAGTNRTIRVVDDKAILYLEAQSTSAALTWVKALNESFQRTR